MKETIYMTPFCILNSTRVLLQENSFLPPPHPLFNKALVLRKKPFASRPNDFFQVIWKIWSNFKDYRYFIFRDFYVVFRLPL